MHDIVVSCFFQRLWFSGLEGGGCLAEPDRQEILQETRTQEKTLDAIGSALDDMRRMGQACLGFSWSSSIPLKICMNATVKDAWQICDHEYIAGG